MQRKTKIRREGTITHTPTFIRSVFKRCLKEVEGLENVRRSHGKERSRPTRNRKVIRQREILCTMSFFGTRFIVILQFVCHSFFVCVWHVVVVVVAAIVVTVVVVWSPIKQSVKSHARHFPKGFRNNGVENKCDCYVVIYGVRWA